MSSRRVLRPPAHFYFLTMVCAMPLLVRAADPPQRATGFVLHTASGADSTGRLQRLGPDWSIELDGTPPARVSGAEVVTLRRAGMALPAFPEQPHVALVNGDYLPGTAQGLVGETLRFRAACGEDRDLKLPLASVSRLWLAIPEGTPSPERFRRQLAAEKRSRDRVYLRNGDILDGIVNTLDGRKLTIEVNRKELNVDVQERVAAICFSTELARRTPPKLPYGHVILANGCRMTIASAEADAHELRGQAAVGFPVRIPLDQLVAVDLRQPGVVYLSDLKPIRYEHTPFLDERWPYVRDGNVLERDLRLRGSTYDKGLGMHSASRLTFALDGVFKRLEAVVGLDDASRDGNAAVQVLIDGKLHDLGTADLLARAPPQPIAIDVRGGRELTLVVNFGKFAHVQDYVNWADARLIR